MPSVIVYHGSPKQFEQFRTPKTHYQKQLGFGIHGTTDRSFAAKYGRFLYTLRFTFGNLLDATQVYKVGTPEADLGLDLYTRISPRMKEYFKKEGLVPINLDITSPGRAVELLKKHGYDAVRYEAVVGGRAHHAAYRSVAAKADSYLVLDPGQVEILDIVDQGAGVKKEYNPRVNPANPYAFREKGEKIVEWGFIDRFGGLIKEPVGNKSRLDHEKLARKVLGMTEHEALTDEGYTRLLVSQWDTGLIQAGVEFYGYDIRPLRAIQRWLDKTEIPVEKVEIMAKEYNLEDVVPGGRFYGTPERAKTWLREYKVPADKGEEREENPRYHAESISTGQFPSWGWISSTGRKTIDGIDRKWDSLGDTSDHQDLAVAAGLEGEVEALGAGYIRYSIQAMPGEHGSKIWLSLNFTPPYKRVAKAVLAWLSGYGDKYPITHVILDAQVLSGGGFDPDQAWDFEGDLRQARAVLREMANSGERPGREENPLTLPPRAKAWANDSKAQVLVEMDPAHFLDLTTNSYSHRQRIIADAQPLDNYNRYVETKESDIPPFLVIELTRGNRDWARVSSHEGRHRAAALINNRESVMPVYIRLRRDYDDPYALSWKDVPDTIMGQYQHPDSRWAKVRKGDLKVVEGDRLARYRRENPAPKRPGDKDLRWPFKLKQVGPHGDVFVAEMADLARYNVVHTQDGTWSWAPENTSRWSETFSTLEGALLNLETEAESHTGRLGGTMKFVIYSPTGTILGTVTAPNRRAARDVMRGSLKALRFKTSQDGYLQPYISSSPEAKYVADQGVQIR